MHYPDKDCKIFHRYSDFHKCYMFTIIEKFVKAADLILFFSGKEVI